MLGWEGDLPQPAVRTVEEMRSVIADPSCESSGPPLLYVPGSRKIGCGLETGYIIINSGMISTVIPSRTLCGEWVKTKGHYHPKNPAGIGYPEIYEVLEGQAHYLLQSRTLDDIVMIAAHPGDLVIIPGVWAYLNQSFSGFNSRHGKYCIYGI